MSVAPVVSMTVTVRGVVEELDREGTKVLLPLLARASGLADLLLEGKTIDPTYLEEGVRLWNDYLHEVRGPRLEAMVKGLEASQGAVAVSAPAGNGRHHLGRRRVEPPRETERDRFDQVEDDIGRETARAGALRDALADYRHQQFQAAQRLASLLQADSFTDRAWIRYEHDTFAPCLNRVFAPEAAAQVEATFSSTEPHRLRLEAAIGRYLELAVPPRT